MLVGPSTGCTDEFKYEIGRQLPKSLVLVQKHHPMEKKWKSTPAEKWLLQETTNDVTRKTMIEMRKT